MDAQFVRDLLIALIIIFFGAMGYLLSRKDSKQDSDRKEDNTRNKEAFNVVFKKIDENKDGITTLQRQLDKNHYEKQDVDKLIGHFEGTVRQGFTELSGKFDNLSEEVKEIGTTIAAHIGREEGKR